MIVITWKIDAFCAFAIIGMTSGGAYAIRPYTGTWKIDTFSGNKVGAYCIRPTNVPFMERITWKRDAFSSSLNMNTKNVIRFLIIRSLYPENVSYFAHSSSLKWYSVGRIHLASTFFSCLDTRKEDKRKSRPLPRPGKMVGYMMEIENAMRLGDIWMLYPEKSTRFPVTR